MEGKDADLADPYFDSEEDEPVDMEMIREGMKLVPLPDMDYPEQDDPLSSDPSTGEHLLASSIPAGLDRVAPQGLLKRKAVSAKTESVKKKGGGTTARAPKRAKVEVQSIEPRYKLSPKQSGKAENLVGSVRAAQAKVAAEVAPNVFTGGIVAETGPRPDFSFWTVDDDLILKNAMEAGAAIEALGKGAVRFSRRFTLRELKERWRALLYDPDIAAEAAARMVEAELAVSNIEGPKIVNELKNPQELALKRRANSIRTLYYKKTKKTLVETVAPVITNGLESSDLEEVSLLGMGPTTDMTGEHAPKLLYAPLDFMAMGVLDTSLLVSLSPKETTTTEFEDQSFTQMFSLLAAGGVRAANAGMSLDTFEQDLGALMDDVQSRVNMSAATGDIFDPRRNKGGDSLESCAENRQLPCVVSEPHLRDSRVVDTCPSIHTHPCESDEEEATITIADIEMDARLQDRSDSSKVGTVGAGTDLHFDGSNGHMHNSAGGYDVSAGLRVDGSALNGDFKDQSVGVYAPTYRDSVMKMVSSAPLSDSDRIGVDGGSENVAHFKMNTVTNITTVKAEVPCEPSLVSVFDHRDGYSADTRLSGLGHGMRIDPPLSEVIDNTKLQEPGSWAHVVGRMDVDVEENEKLEEDVKICCECGRFQRIGNSHDSLEDHTYISDQGDLGEGHDNFPPLVISGESRSPDLDSRHGENFDGGYSTLPPSDMIENVNCIVNTEDTSDIPDLDDVLHYPPSPSPPSSPSEEEYLAMLESPLENTGPEGDCDAVVEAEGILEHHGDEYKYVGSPLRVDAASIKYEPNYEIFCDPMHDPRKLGSFVDRSGEMMVRGDNLERVGEVAACHQDAAVESRSADLMNCMVHNTHASSVSEQCLPCSPIVGNLHQQGLHLGLVDCLQPASSWGALECQTTTASTSQCTPNLASRQVEMVSRDREAGNMEPGLPPTGDSPPVIPPTEQVPASREPSMLASELPEEVLESDDESVQFSDIETMILDMDLDPVADDDFSARAESRRNYRRHGKEFVRLEQASSAAMQRSLNSREALAVIYGRNLKYFITQPEVMMGRATSDNVVDIDLGREGRANKVSRQQANIKLKDDGVFYLRNLGRRGLTVNNRAVETGQRAILGSNCLIEVGGMWFIFEFNRKLVKEYTERRHQEQ